MTVVRGGASEATGKSSDAGDRLIFSYHFLLLDGWSREQLLRELFAEYAAARSGGRAEIPSSTADFTDYLRWLAGRDRDASARKWADSLASLQTPTLLAPAAVGTDPTLSGLCASACTSH